MENPEWASLDDEQLLEWRIRKLGLRIEETPLQAYVQQLYDELSARGLFFFPSCHIGDEWFVPVGIPSIFVPFFLAHDRLRDLERRMVFEVEGESREWFMQLMRHEAAHAYSYAYNLYRKRRWQQAFGLASTEDTGFYEPRPYSRSYVVHLDDWYAQAHPDEDFAETFAVWLTPNSDWRTRYKGWKALRKLEYVDELMGTLVGKPPRHNPEFRVADYDCLGVKLKTYYNRKRKLYSDNYPDLYDKDLRRLFPETAGQAGTMAAATYLKRNQKDIMNAVCAWTKERKYRVDQFLKRLIMRCHELGLAVSVEDQRVPLRVAAYIATSVMNYLFTGRFKRGK